MIFIFILVYLRSAAACIWYAPAVIFPTDLVHLESDLFHRRRLASVTGSTTDVQLVTVGGSTSQNDGRSTSRNGNGSTSRNGGLSTTGSVQYSVIFDASIAVKDLEYRVESITPLTVPTYTLSGTTTLVKIDHTLADALAFEDMLVVTMSAWSPCLPTRALSESSYTFNVTASYEMFFEEHNTLAPTGGATAVSIRLPQSNHTHKYVQTPCLDSFIQSSIQVLNTSLYTQWLAGSWPEYKEYQQSGGGPPRCHFKGHGSVCTVVARARFEYSQACSRPVTFSLWQTVSQIASYHSNWSMSTERPVDFDASHRLPVSDGVDMRYDMCEARVCSSDACTTIDIQNDKYALAGHIKLNQTLLAMRGVLETECRFEVVAFMDDIWSPWLHFRQSVGYTIS